MLRRIERWINRHIKYRNAELTPKGECFKNYCENVVGDSINGRIEPYEDFIQYIAYQIAEECGIVLDRKDTAEFILTTYEEIL